MKLDLENKNMELRPSIGEIFNGILFSKI